MARERVAHAGLPGHARARTPLEPSSQIGGSGASSGIARSPRNIGRQGVRTAAEREQLGQQLQEVLAVGGAQRPASPSRPSPARSRGKVDAAGMQRGEGAERLGHAQRRVVGQHHAAGADAQPGRVRRHVRDQHLGRRARDAGHRVVLGRPVTRRSPAVRPGWGQIDGAPHRLGVTAARGNGREVEDGKRGRRRHAAIMHPRAGNPRVQGTDRAPWIPAHHRNDAGQDSRMRRSGHMSTDCAKGDFPRGAVIPKDRDRRSERQRSGS